MALTYTVQAGDTLTAIARRHGFSDWRTIYGAPENADFRRKRPNPDRIYPGDLLVIPGQGEPGAHPHFPGTCGPPILTPTAIRIVDSRRTVQQVIRPTFDQDSVRVKAGVRQFQWTARALRQDGSSDCLLVGFLQTLLFNEVTADYAATGQDPRPRKARVVLASMPIRDHAGRGVAAPFDWAAVRTVGDCASSGLAPAVSPLAPTPTATTSAVLSFGDDPGGRFPLNDPDFRDKPLRRVSIKHRFCTWIASRPPRSPADQQASYEFLQHTIWTVDRAFDVTHGTGGPVAHFTVNETKIERTGDGIGPEKPVLKPPDANTSAKLVFS